MGGRTESIELVVKLSVGAEELYRAWLDSKKHSAFTKAKAVIDPRIGGRHTAWDGYIQGITLELEPGRRIVQSWRTSEFPEHSEDSLLELLFDQQTGGTRLTLRHTHIPEGEGEKYREGWQESYFDPMRAYFGSRQKKK